MNNQTELGNAITTSIGIMSVEHVPELVDLLQKSGSSVTTSSSQQELLEAAFSALKNSDRFRNDLATYLSKEAISSDSNYGNYVENGFFSNFSNPFNGSSNVANYIGETIANLSHKGSVVHLKSGSNYKGFSGDNNFFNFVGEDIFSDSRKQIIFKK